MYKYLEMDHHHGDRNRHSKIAHGRILENLRQRKTPLFLIIGRGEEYQFLRDCRMFRNSQRYYASSFTDADMSLLQQFCDGNIPERLESTLGVAVNCIKVDAKCRHTGAEPITVRNVKNLSSEVLVQMLYFHYYRKSSLQARHESKIEELEATVNNMLTVEGDLRAQDTRLLDSLRRAEQQAVTAENELEAETTLRQQAEATVNNMLNVEDDLRAQNARLIDSLHRAEHQAEIAENELQAETRLRQQAETSRGRAVRRAEHRLRDEYARQHDEWFHDLRNYRTDREQYGPAFEDSVEAPGRASGDDRSWLDLRRETSELFTDLEIADNAQADLEADLSRVRRQRNHALRERDHLHGQLWHAQAHNNRQHHQIGWPYR